MISSLKIVIAENNALIGMDLAELGHHVCALVSTEAEAVGAAVRCNPDMMIVDSALAEGSGVSAMQRILERGPMPYFFLTGDPREALKMLADAVVVMKPFNLQDLEVGIAAVRPVNGLVVPHLPDPHLCLPTCQFLTCFQRMGAN